MLRLAVVVQASKEASASKKIVPSIDWTRLILLIISYTLSPPDVPKRLAINVLATRY